MVLVVGFRIMKSSPGRPVTVMTPMTRDVTSMVVGFLSSEDREVDHAPWSRTKFQNLVYEH